MSYKSILVHLDTSARAHPRLEMALQLAHRFHARLTGLFSTYVPPRHAFAVMAGTAEYYAEHARQRHEKAAALERLFHAELTRAKVDGQWIAADGYANDVVPPYARLADLIVLGQSDPTDPESLRRRTVRRAHRAVGGTARAAGTVRGHVARTGQAHTDRVGRQP